MASEPNLNGAAKNSPENGGNTGELSEKAREYYQKLGKKTYDLTTIKLDEKSVKNTAAALAVEAADADEENRREQFKEKHEKLASFCESKIGKVVTALPAGLSRTVRRAIAINDYRKNAEKAINETGKMSAGAVVVENLRKIKDFNEDLLTEEEKEKSIFVDDKMSDKEKRNNVLDSIDILLNESDQSVDEALSARVDEAIKAGDDNVDAGVKVEEKENSDDIRAALTEYAQKIATMKKNGTKVKRSAMSELKSKLGHDYNEYKDKIDELTDDLRGKLRGAEHKAAMEAIDAYITENVNIRNVKVDAGLAVDEVYKSSSDKAAANFGVVAGIAVGIGGTCLGYMKNSVISKVTNSTIIGTSMKMALAGGIGAAKGYANKEREQRSENIEKALNVDDEEKKGQVPVISVDKKIAEMQSIEFKDGKFIKRNEDGGEIDVKLYEVRDMIAELRAKNELQNESRAIKGFKNGVQLLGFNGRENVEATKLAMFKEINRLQSALFSTSDDAKDNLEFQITGEKAKYRKELMDISKEQRKERRGAALKTGLIAAGAAGVTSFAFDYIRGAIQSKELFSIDNSKLLSEINGLKNGDLKWDGLRVVAAGDIAGTAAASVAEVVEDAGDNGEAQNVIKEHNGALIIEDDPQGGVSVGFDADGDGKLDAGEFLHGEGVEEGLDLTSDEAYEKLATELQEYGVELSREPIVSSAYNEISIGEYLENKENAVEVNGVDWAKSATKVAFGRPVAVAADGMDQYEVSISGFGGNEIPEGAKFFIDLDGDGPGKALEFPIENGKAIIPADIVDTSSVGEGGVAKFIGVARVGEIQDGNMISYATAVGKKAVLDSTISANVSENAYAFTAIGADGEKISQFAVNASNEKISNLSEIFNGIEVENNDRLPSTFTVHDIDGDSSAITLASGESFGDYDVSGGYHPEFDAFENKAFFAGNNYLGTPMTWDTNGDGIMDSAEELSYIKQMFVRTGTNPFMLGQNASNYGILEPARLNSIIDVELLKTWGIEDGVVDSEADLNVLLEALKQPENAMYWDKLANETINEMEKQLQGGGFELETVTNRLSTYANSNELLDTAHSKTERYVLYPYHMNEDGTKEYVGNQGWWCRKYGAEGGKVGDLPLCEQKSITTKVGTGSENSETTETSEGNEGTGSENSETTETSEGNEGTGSENSETTETSEGNEGTGSEDSENTENSETTETSENVENTPKNAQAIIDNMGIHGESTNVVTPAEVTAPTDVPTFEQPVNVAGTQAEVATQEVANAAAAEVGETPIMSQEEKAKLFEQF